MLSDEWLSSYGLLGNFNASVTRTGTGTHTGTGTWTTGVTAIALCTSCSRANNDESSSNNLCILLNLVNFQMIPRACKLENTLKSIEFSKVTSKYVY